MLNLSLARAPRAQSRPVAATQTGTEPLIAIRDLRKDYVMGAETVHALAGVSFDIHQGEYVAIMGPSGSGKSTLMNLIGALDRPSSGQYFLAGQDVATLSPDKTAEFRNNHIGFVFQSFNLLGRTTALGNVELPMIYKGLPAKERRNRARDMLTAVGLGERTGHRPTQLSGGQQQRVAIARALANRPSILLADEPTGALDQKTGQEILALFDSLNDQGLTIIVVTHDPGVAERARRVLSFRDGKLVDDKRNR